MRLAAALLLFVFAAALARAQSADAPERTPAERFAEVETNAWGGVLANIERISAMLDRIDAPTGTRTRQDSLIVAANASSATRGALFILIQFTGTHLDPDRDAALQPLAEAALGLVDLLGETAFEAAQDATTAGTAGKTLDGPPRAVRLREFADSLRQHTATLGIPTP